MAAQAKRRFGAACSMLGLVLWAGTGVAGATEFPAQQLEFFEKRVRPVLAEHCHQCHSRSAEKVKAGLLLDHRADLLAGGDSGPAIIPGRPGESRLVRAISYEDVDLQMPPKSRLTPAQVADITQWIADGAAWPAESAPVETTARKGGFNLEERRSTHWVWAPIRKPEPPGVAHAEWEQSPIDAFVLAGLDEHGLSPAPPADKRTLLRRASYDLIGLPPTPAEIDDFLADDSPRAFAKVVDRLLASKHFGERWGRHWLDLVRYAETMGHEFDYSIQGAWRYRDYIIRALNADVPYNQLVREHVAGDLLPRPRRDEDGVNESAIGTLFYWLGQQKHSPVDVTQEQSDLIDNQIDVLSKTFLGVTVACARCHDHKFDAITTEDFYSFYGILESSRYSHTIIDDPAKFEPGIARYRELRAQLREALGEQFDRAATEVPKYLLAAREAMTTGPESAPPGQVVFEDFEDTLTGWTVEGDAFDLEPQTQESIGAYQGNVGAVGKGFVNSHNHHEQGATVRADKFTGTLTSPEFTLSQPYIHFLVGGGGQEGGTCVNLLVDGRAVRTATGRNKNRMGPATWDVREFQGQSARIQVVDRVSGGWGNIGLDQIVFSPAPQYFGPDNQPLPQPADSALVAARHQLDPGRLDRWVQALAEPDAPYSAMWAWARASREPHPDVPAILKVADNHGAPESLHPGDITFADFRRDSLKGWFPRGYAFREGVVKTGEVVVEEGVPYLNPESWVNSGVLSPRLEGQLQSPTFKIVKPYLLMRVAGLKTRINIVVDNFTLIRNPIYGDLKQEVKDPKFHWIVVDVSMWLGHNCYLEFADNSARDPAGADYPTDGFLGVQRVIFSDQANPPAEADWEPCALAGEGVTDVAQLAGAYGREVSRAAGLWRERKDLDPALLNWLLLHRLLGDPDGRVAGLLAEYDKVRVPVPTTIAGITDGTPRDEFIFIRGSHRNPGEPAHRDFLTALRSLHPEPFRQGSGRLELAECIVHPDNPLTARVMANRVWHHLLGRGIVPTVDDFGVLGQRPSHPELLDWLATSFREDGWSIKELIRRVMLSSTYQMSSQPNDAAAEAADPTNVWLHRARVRRLEGEALRDGILAVSGSLDPEMFGPSVPIHLTSFMEGRGRPGTIGPLDGNCRRSIYVEVRRNFLSPMMLAFDTPLPATTMGRRAVSNVPAQALILMNDPFVVQEARRWAERLLTREAGTEDRVREIYRAALGREPEPGELADATAFVQARRGDPAIDVWADLCHVMFNLKEFFFLN